MMDHNDTRLATLIHSWDTTPVHPPPRTGRASVYSWPTSRVLGPSSNSCAAQTKFETIKTVHRFFSDYDRRKQLVILKNESSLLVQRLGKPLRSSPGGFAFRSLLRGAGGEGWPPNPAWITRPCDGVQNLTYVLFFIPP